MGHLLPALTDAKLRIQKDVVKNEYRQNYANRPYGQAWRLLAEAMYPPDHPYSWLTIGLMEDVEAATRDDVEGVLPPLLRPGNASLCLVGDIDEDRGLRPGRALLRPDRRRLGGPAAPARPTRGSAGRRGRSACATASSWTATTSTWHTVAQFHADDAAARPAGRHPGPRAVEPAVSQAGRRAGAGAGRLGLPVEPRAGRHLRRRHDPAARPLVAGRPATLVDAELAEIARAGRRGGGTGARPHGQGRGVHLRAGQRRRIRRRGRPAERLQHLPGRPLADHLGRRRFQEVTAEDVRARGRGLPGRASPRDPDGPRAREDAPAAAPLDRAIPPAPAPAAAFRAPVPEVRTLRCGAPLWVIPRRDLPIVAATAVVTAGASAHGPDLGGLAALTASMLDEGTATRTGRADRPGGRGDGHAASRPRAAGTARMSACNA